MQQEEDEKRQVEETIWSAERQSARDKQATPLPSYSPVNSSRSFQSLKWEKLAPVGRAGKSKEMTIRADYDLVRSLRAQFVKISNRSNSWTRYRAPGPNAVTGLKMS